MKYAANPPQLRVLQKPEPHRCSASIQFGQWTQQLIQGLTPEGKEPTLLSLNQARFRLTERYWQVRGSLTDHRDLVTDPTGDPCVYGLWIAAMEQLDDIEFRIAPPQLTKPPAKPKSPPPPPAPEVPKAKTLTEQFQEAAEKLYEDF
jgi:hypothetical protein